MESVLRGLHCSFYCTHSGCGPQRSNGDAEIIRCPERLRKLLAGSESHGVYGTSSESHRCGPCVKSPSQEMNFAESFRKEIRPWRNKVAVAGWCLLLVCSSLFAAAQRSGNLLSQVQKQIEAG